MNRIEIGNETPAGKNVTYPVRLDGKLVGTIKRTWAEDGHGRYQYKPTGGKGGEFFLSLRSCVNSLQDQPDYPVKFIRAGVYKCGPITWTLDTSNKDREKDQSYDATLTGSRDSDRELKLTCFHVKNYGPRKSFDRSDKHGFVGWQVGSGGPFEWMGPHTDKVEDVIRRATPWLVSYWREQAMEKIEEARQLVTMLDATLNTKLKG